ncbi:MAG: EAL domain-containing protein [Rhodocyclaceae bacterium]|nr:EAL domain-containing protein [Rhodocyclaceae bacterium]MDZ4215979.1 EAL domain-containing protein [Rhodocyclaceae bacterium]
MSLPDHAQDVFLARQPILDRNQELVAYELLFRSGDHDEARFSCGHAATATVISHAFGNLGITAALGPYRAFINIDKDFLQHEALQFLPPNQVVIEVLEGNLVTPEVVARCAELKGMGYTLALDDFTRVTDDYVPLLPLASIIKVDLTLVSVEDLPGLVAQLRPLVPQLLAEKVETAEEFERCLALGFDLFQGYYFARPTIIAGRRLQPSQITTLRLIAMVAKEAETPEIELALKQDPALSVSMLRLVNSVGMGRGRNISSLRQAVMVLGRQHFSRWLQLLLYTDTSKRSKSPLLTMAALRGRFSELVAEHTCPGDRHMKDAAFMVGILSLTPALLGQSMDSILQHLNLSQPIQDALYERKGILGAILEMAESLESGAISTCQECLHKLPLLDAGQLNACHAEALAWANKIGCDVHE